LQLLIKWELSNFFRKYNKKRNAEVDFSLSSNESSDENLLNLNYTIGKIINDYNLDLKVNDVVDYLIYDQEITINNDDLKILCWDFYKNL